MPAMTDSGYPLFDPDNARGADMRPDVGKDVTDEITGSSSGAERPWSVSLLVGRIKNALDEAFPQSVYVVGEISNFKRHPSSGHLYFRLKDDRCAIDAVMFRRDAAKLKFSPSDGLEVVAEGRVDVYDRRGQLQLYVRQITPKGAGALELAFRQLREKLQTEGLFDDRHKKPIPRIPRAIGIVTSAAGAAIRDIRRTLSARWPAVRAYLLPVAVQGEGSAEQIARAVALLDANAVRLGIETIIVARGGGSLEDLWSFNEEAVARAIFAAETPVISGVGHEVDVTIADMVADARAATPTAAAALAVPDRREMRQYLAQLAGRARRRLAEKVATARASLKSVLRSVAFRDPTVRLRTHSREVDELSIRLRSGTAALLNRDRRKLEQPAQRLAELHPARRREQATGRLERAVARLRWALGARAKRSGDRLARTEAQLHRADPRQRLKLHRQKIDALARQLESMSHRNVLRRGFSITRGRDGKILRSIQDVSAGDALLTELSDGKLRSTVNGKKREHTDR
ncbi:MAG: exodeoxyribonuclease VII large subunit [Phycisphaerae bacterium]